MLDRIHETRLDSNVSVKLTAMGLDVSDDLCVRLMDEVLSRARAQGAPIDLEDVTYFLGRETLIVSKQPGMSQWREKLFVIMARNAVRATAFFRLPPERVVELGVQVEM